LLGAAEPKPVRTIQDLRLSPDAATLLFTELWPDVANNAVHSRLMCVGKDRVVSEVAGAPEGAGDLVWSPDGTRYAFRAGGALWVNEPGRRPRRICAADHSNSYLPRTAASLAWSPDGRLLAFSGTREPVPAPADPRVLNRIQYRNRTGFSDNRRNHIFLVPSEGGAVRQLTHGDWDEHSLEWGGDGHEILFVSNREADPDARFNYDLFAVDVATGRLRRLTRTPGVEMSPRLSPDGRWIACLATRRPVTTIDSIAEDPHVWLIPSAGGEARDLTAALDRRCQAPRWSHDGRFVYYLAADHGRNVLRRSSLEGASEVVLERAGDVSEFALARRAAAVVYAWSDPAHPVEIYSGTRRLTHRNRAPERLSLPREMRFRSFDGTGVQAWLYPALSPEPLWPLVLLIHGGPHAQFTVAFNTPVQELARAGFAVLAVNPRGSAGYGQKFSDGTLGDWGGGDYRDLMAGVDHALALEPRLDPHRLAVTGASYGGYMANWIVTHTDRFRAAVAVSGLSNLVSFYGTSLYPDLIEAEFGRPWQGDNFRILWERSPLAAVGAAHSPILLLHGEVDNDVPVTQSEEMYMALRQRGVPAVLVRYPREGHGFREPRHVEDARARTIAWLRRYLAAF
jgi:dipeptidyl aminopeptidase/acylaminoacyl peptidase